MNNDGYEQHLAYVRKRRAALESRLAEMFPEPVSLSLEIGCGHGHWLVDYAAAHPDKRCLGVDIIGDRIDRANRKKRRVAVANAHFLKGEAMEVLDLMPEHVSLAEVFVLFPDPWPKKRHWKNRLFSSRFLEELSSRCAAGVRCHFRTDHEGYYEWAEALVAEQDSWSRMEALEWPFERETVFQAKADRYQSLVLVKV